MVKSLTITLLQFLSEKVMKICRYLMNSWVIFCCLLFWLTVYGTMRTS